MGALDSSESLLKALTGIALKIQGVRTVRNVVSEAAGGLEALGFQVALFANANGKFVPRYATQLPQTEAAIGALREALDRHGSTDLDQGFQTVLYAAKPVFIPDVVTAAQRLVGPSPFGDALFAIMRETGPWQAMLAPLMVRGIPWGAAAYAHRELRADHIEAVSLFSLQFGLSIEVAETIERLEKRNAELEMIRALAESGPTSDTRLLIESALSVLCWLTDSESASLYRVESGLHYRMVGDPVGFTGPVPELFREFTANSKEFVAGPVRRFPVSAFPNSAPAMAKAGIRHVAVLPLNIEGRAIGLVALGRKTDTPFDDEEVAEAQTLGVQLASLLERSRLYDESRQYNLQLKASYERLELTQQELVRHERLAAHGEVAAVMAHQVRNPLGVIFNSVATLKRLIPASADVSTLLTMLEEEADRLNRIVSDLLDFVRPIELARQPIAIAPVVEAAIDAASTLLGSSALNVLLEVSETLPPFAIDAHLLRQALANLVVNGIQSMPRGGQVRVSASVEKRGEAPWLVLTVSDEGKGLSELSTDKMYQPFFTTKAVGTGLGLAVVKRIVDAHAGTIDARPNVDGPGTTFVISLPSLGDRSRVLTPPKPSPSAPRPRST